jgi:hypothetical protein
MYKKDGVSEEQHISAEDMAAEIAAARALKEVGQSA